MNFAGVPNEFVSLTHSYVSLHIDLKGFIMTFNSKKTSSGIASQAAETLKNPNASAMAKSLAGSALAQVQGSYQTGKAMETKASHVLQSNKYSDDTKALAASLLSQSNRLR